jgi:hypothetical protein
LSHEGDVHTRVGAGERHQIRLEEELGGDRKGVGLGTKEAGDAQTNLFIFGIYHGKIALSAGTFHTDHIGGQREYADEAGHCRAAVRTAVGKGGLFLIQNHIYPILFIEYMYYYNT